MTVGTASAQATGRLFSVTEEHEREESEGIAVTLALKTGAIHADLSIGANVAAVQSLRANENLTSMGVMLAGSGFIVTREEAARLTPDVGANLIRAYRNGRDLTDTPRGVCVIDAYGLTAEQLRERHPAVYQWLLERVKPERDANRRDRLRERWWIFAEARPNLRKMTAGLPRYIATVETAKHRTFQFLDASVLPDHKLIAIGSADAATLAVLSSAPHGRWAKATGGHMGVGNDPVYNKTRCFETFSFPDLSPEARTQLAALGERLDAHRKRQQAAHAGLTLTGMYNLLDKLRSGEALSAKERLTHEQGLCSLLREIHDEIDCAVFAAYGWQDLIPLLGVVAKGNTAPGERAAAQETLTAALLERLAALNAERAGEEARGLIRWLRPEFQNPQAREEKIPVQVEMPVAGGEALSPSPSPARGRGEQQPWPDELPQQVAAVARVLAEAVAPLSLNAVAARFSGRGPWKRRLPQLLETLEALGRVQRGEAGWVAV